MRDFVIINKEDTTKKATLRVDMVEDKTEKLTIMWCDGVRDTEFEKIIPWKCGTVTSMTEIEEWATQYQSELDVYMYGGEQVQVLGAPTHKLTVTATVTNNSKANVILKGTKEGALPVSDEIELTSGEPKEIQGIEGYSYTWELVSPYTWTSGAPEAFVCTEDKDIALAISFPVA